MGYSFYTPEWLWLLLVVPILLYLNYLRFSKSKGAIKSPLSAQQLQSVSFQPMKIIILATYTAIGLGLIFCMLAMARPYSANQQPKNNYGRGIDIMIAMDVSGSMMATDFLPNRLEAAKDVAIDFINHRKSDRIGFVAFSGEAYTVCPLTQDYDYLKQTIQRVQSGVMKQGTAIGIGLGTAVAQMYKDTIASKVIILLTDGVNNVGEISPMDAAQIAKNKHITVYTIGVGKKGFVETPVVTPFGKIMQRSQVNIDENLLKDIAKTTDGKYFRAVNKNSLRQIYEKINHMEKSKLITAAIQPQPPFQPKEFLIYGLILLLVGMLTEQLLLRYDVA